MSLTRRTPLRRGRPKRRPAISDDVRERAAQRSHGRCVGCGRPATELHHVFAVRLFPELVDVEANLVAVDRQCHARHESAFYRLALSVLPACAVALAIGDPTREAYLARTYWDDAELPTVREARAMRPRSALDPITNHDEDAA